MKVWVEWKLRQDCGSIITPRSPNVFTTKENLAEFWKRVRFPVDTVDYLFNRMTELGRTGVECDGWYAAEVEVDEYFVKKGSNDEQDKHPDNGGDMLRYMDFQGDDVEREADAETSGDPHRKTKGTARSCPRCKQSKKGCEYYDAGTCRGVVYPTYPPQYDPCVFE